MRIIDGRKNPAAAKFAGWKAHQRVLTLVKERGLVSTVAPNGLFYSNADGAFGTVSDGGNWDRLASAVHRWALKLVGESDYHTLQFPDDSPAPAKC